MKSAFLALLFVGLAAAIGQAYAADPKPSAKAPEANDPTALSSSFWTDWNETKSSANFSALSSAADCGCGPAPQGAQDKAQAPSTVDIAITNPAEAAEFLGKSLASSNDPVTETAIATVVKMRMSPEVRQAAAPLVAPEAQARVEQFRANLSTGIPGLPGIYLGDNSGSGSYGERLALPQGYRPVAGPSMGCPSRN